MFIFDVETLGIKPNAIILSASVIYFDPEVDYTYQSLLEASHTVKFDAREQKEQYGRSIDSKVLNWWSNQSDRSKKVSFEPKSSDLSVVDGLASLRQYITAIPDWKRHTVWARGNMDQLWIESLCADADQDNIFYYSNWRDVRTAVDLLTGSRDGYCSVEGLNPAVDVIKHDPSHDCAYDAIMLLKGKC